MINWFEIPAADISRAVNFYSTVLDMPIEVSDMGGTPYAFLTGPEAGLGGAIAQGEQYQPATEGVTIYLKVADDLQPTLERVESAGGKTVVPKTSLGGNLGYFALFLDSEGNKIGLWSPQ